VTDPATYLRIAASLVPKEMNVAVQQQTPGNLDPADWEVLRRVVDLIRANAPDRDLSSTLALLEDTLRADQAKVIEPE
jgi:hypothetical protein